MLAKIHVTLWRPTRRQRTKRECKFIGTREFVYQYLTQMLPLWLRIHYNDVIMSAMASQITGVSIVCSAVSSGADQRKHQSSASLAFVWGIHRFSFDDVIMFEFYTDIFGNLSWYPCKVDPVLVHYMITSWRGHAFLITGPLWRESTGRQWTFIIEK